MVTTVSAIYDLDNTLIDSKKKLQADLVGTMRRLGTEVPIDEINGDWYSMAEQYGHTKEQFDEAFSHRKTWEESLRAGDVKIFPETIQCLDELADEGIIMCLLSKSIPSYTHTKLDYFGLTKYFERIVTVHPSEPSKFSGAQKILDVIAANKVYLIGDKEEDIAFAPQVRKKFNVSCDGIYINRNGRQLSGYQNAVNLYEINKIILENGK